MKIRPFDTPHTMPEPDDGVHQPRERSVLCARHFRPTWRTDQQCSICLDERAS
jgi:hypothetical protein